MIRHDTTRAGGRARWARSREFLSSVRVMIADRRGATAALFGVAATAVVGFAGLATEAGYWYNVRRDAQNAADHAAFAGAVRLGVATNVLENADGTKLTDAARLTQIQNAGRDTTARNGFTHNANNNTVDVNWPPVSGAYAGNTNAVQVIITQQRPRLISALFLASANQQIRVSGVAALQDLGSACVLALEDSLIIGGNTTLMAPGCLLASNSTSNRAVNFNGAARTIDASYIVAAGGCDGCNAAVTPGGASIPYSTNGPGVTNPFTWTDAVIPPALSCSGAGNTQGPIGPYTYTADVNGTPVTSNYYIVCKDWSVGSNTSYTLPGPGTYFFYGTSLDIKGTLNWTCGTVEPCSTTTLGGPGVTLAFVRDGSGKVGKVSSNSSAVINLKAPATGYGLYPGLVIYRQRGTNETGMVNTAIQINGGSTSTRLAGAIYGSNADVIFNGNADIAQTGCLVIVGWKVELTGNAYTRAGNCSELNPNILNHVQVARMVE